MKKVLNVFAVLGAMNVCSLNNIMADNSLELINSHYLSSCESSINENKLSPESFMSKAHELIGKKVQIKGKVVHICSHGGKKCNLTGENQDVSVQIIAGEGIKRFDKSLMENDVIVIGTVKERRIERSKIQEQEKSISKKESHQHENKHCSHSSAKNKEMIEWMDKNKKDYYPVYYIEGESYKVIK